jgi:ABC-type antimicrobial peptide transport system permease subunit
VGSLFGFAGYWIVARLVASRLFRVAPLDPTAVGGAAILLAILVFAGAALAARRATKVDPVTALRAD